MPPHLTSRWMSRRLLAVLGRAFYFCMGFRVVVKGRPVSGTEAPVVVVAPHSTFFDGIVCVVAGLPSIVSREENLAAPVFGSETLARFVLPARTNVRPRDANAGRVFSTLRRGSALSPAGAGVQDGSGLQEEDDPRD